MSRKPPATPVAAAALDADDLFDAIEDVLTGMRDVSGIPKTF